LATHYEILLVAGALRILLQNEPEDISTHTMIFAASFSPTEREAFIRDYFEMFDGCTGGAMIQIHSTERKKRISYLLVKETKLFERKWRSSGGFESTSSLIQALLCRVAPIQYVTLMGSDFS